MAEAPASLECEVVQIVELPGAANLVAFGQVVGVHIRDEYLTDGRFDLRKVRPLSRLGYRDYAVVENPFTLARPGD